MRRRKKGKNNEMLEKLDVWEYFDFATEGFFVEVGANQPMTGSQSWLLERVGWKGILVEPLPDRSEELRRHRPGSIVFQVAVSAPEMTGEREFHVHDGLSSLERNVINPDVCYQSVIPVRVVTLDSILEQSAVKGIDFLSIDTEGTEMDVLRGFDIRSHRPRLLLIEDLLYSLDKHRHLTRCDYRLVRRTGNNSWYVPEESRFPGSLVERARMFRKVWLGTHIRGMKFQRRRRALG